MRLRLLVLGTLMLGSPLDVPDTSRIPSVDLQPDPTFVVADSVRAQLAIISDLALDPDGSVYLADRLFPAVLHLERDGSLRRILGRGGDGPGEFSYVFQLGVVGDSLWTTDPGLNRVTLFARSGRGVRTVPYGFAYAGPVNDDRPRLRRGVVVAMLPRGEFLAVAEVPPAGNPEGSPRELTLLRIDRQNVVVDTVITVPFGHTALRFFYRTGATTMHQPFTDDPALGNASDGSLVIRVSRTVASTATLGRFTVTAWRGDGARPLWTRQVSYRPARITPGLIDSVLAPYGRIDPAAPPKPITVDSIRDHLYLPGMRPPVGQVVVGQDRSIWLQVYLGDTPANRAEWLLLSPNGYPIRRVTTDPRFRLMEADRATLWGTIVDPDDVPQVVRYRVPPAS